MLELREISAFDEVNQQLHATYETIVVDVWSTVTIILAMPLIEGGNRITFYNLRIFGVKEKESSNLASDILCDGSN